MKILCCRLDGVVCGHPGRSVCLASSELSFRVLGTGAFETKPFRSLRAAVVNRGLSPSLASTDLTLDRCDFLCCIVSVTSAGLALLLLAGRPLCGPVEKACSERVKAICFSTDKAWERCVGMKVEVAMGLGG